MSESNDDDTNGTNENQAATQTDQGVPPQLRIERIFLEGRVV